MLQEIFDMKRLAISISILIMLAPTLVGAISLSPSVLELSASRGEIIEQTIAVANTSDTEQTYFLGVMKFVSHEDGKSPKFIPYREDHTGLPEWISLPFSEFRVPANSKGDVPFKIAVPADASSGGYYAAITVSGSPSDLVADNGAIVDAKTAVLILLTVEGETVEMMEVLELVNNEQATGRSVKGPFEYRVQNQGNVHVTPIGTVTVEDYFGRFVASYDANPNDSRVLPGTTRSFKTLIGDQKSWFAIGPMKAWLSVEYGSSKQLAVAQTSFWYVPWGAVGTILVALIILGSFSRLRRLQDDKKKNLTSP